MIIYVRYYAYDRRYNRNCQTDQRNNYVRYFFVTGNQVIDLTGKVIGYA